MAVAIAAGLDKDMAGTPLLRGVSFKLERRDRMTLSGRNGSGKTTLLRMLAGLASIDGGELSLEKGTRISLHDQRPPREQDVSLRQACQGPETKRALPPANSSTEVPTASRTQRSWATRTTAASSSTR